ncbi:MAG: SycD/LcrH family type III secretion system chaperone [Aeromonadales bacterium]|nr:SycD/LcrH family type III secretion system chaperone [Aeromonadales bacterium]MDY2890467.1 SycD/LcrH family type III secretion system chaperone [Succinivibrio sp.]
MSEEDKNNDGSLSPVTVGEAIKRLENGESIGDMIGIHKEQTEILYALGYSLYTGGMYMDAEKVFRALCVYDGGDQRFWMGLGGCLDQLGNFDEAAQIYGMAATMSGLKDPEPMYYAARCFLRGGNAEYALDALDFLSTMGREGNARDAEFLKKGQELRKALSERK